MKRTRLLTLTLAIVAMTAFSFGCASSGSNTREGPPEVPEKSPESGTGAQDAASESQGGGQGSGSGGSGDEGEGAGDGAGGTGAGTDSGASSEGAGESSSQSSSEGAGGQAGASTGPPPDGSPITDAETTNALDAELAASSGAFDAKMLEELRQLAAEAAERPVESGPPAGAPGSGPQAGGGSNVGGEDGAENSGGVGGTSTEAAGSQDVPPDVGDGSDDDIVARQLREAAIEEKDPELKEKLWEEYRRYKTSVSGSSKGDS